MNDQDEPSWTCFHCGDRFTDREAARAHFGASEASEPACRIKAGAEGSLVECLRRAEVDAAAAWAALHEESPDAVKAMRAQAGRHARQLQAAEELGFERGIDCRRRKAAGPHNTTADRVAAEIARERARQVEAKA